MADTLPLYSDLSMPLTLSCSTSDFLAWANRLRTVLGGSPSSLAISDSFMPS